MTLSGEQDALLWAHYQTLLKWNRKINLTRVTALEEAVRRHYAESLFLAAQISEGISALCDVGSGAGFPGFPVAVARPGVQVTLVESDQRKAAFLREACCTAPNVRVQSVRAESLTSRFDAVISRAVRPAEVLETAVRLASSTALLCSHGDGETLASDPRIARPRLETLPWDEQSVVFLADVPRET